MESRLAIVPSSPASLPSRAALDALVDALQSEKRLLEELITIMRRQRAAVAADDLQGVDASVFATHRVLLTLGEAKRRRRQLNVLIGGSEELGIAELQNALGAQMSKPLTQAREELQAAALTLSQEVELNRRVLREALASGDDYMRALCGSGEPALLYGSEPSGERDGRGSGAGAAGVLINRTV
jgi:FlgN protein